MFLACGIVEHFVGVQGTRRDATFCMAFDSRAAINHDATGEQSRVTRRVVVDFERFRFIIIFHPVTTRAAILR